MTNRFKFFIVLTAFAGVFMTGCDAVKSILGETDIAGGLKEALIRGVTKSRDDAQSGSLFNGTNVLDGILPEGATKIIKTLETLGLGSEITKFSTTLTNAATKSAEKSVPVFINGIRNINFRDAVAILSGGYNAATDYLRNSIGDSLRSAIKPEIAAVLTQYKLPQTLGDIAGKNLPVIGSQKLNIDFTSVLAQLVANKMFKEIEATEYKIRTDISARTTPLLQRVFGDSRAFKQ
ncbi:MAG: DUF4197 domain-containing protein [Chitinophagaceae bacterium]